MHIHEKTLHFKFRLRHGSWRDVNIHLDHLKKVDLRDEETLAEEIWEHVYAVESDAFRNEDQIEFCEKNFWSGIVVPCHKALCPRV